MRSFLLCLLLLPGCASKPLPSERLTDDALVRYYVAEAGVKPITANGFRLYDGGPPIKSAFMELIEGAEDYILIDSFLLNDGAEARPLYEALKAKQRQGVRVFLIGDSSSRFVPEVAAFDYLERAGLPHAEFHPIGFSSVLMIPHLLERDHRKFWVVDGSVVLLGGANINEQSLRPTQSGGNRDLMVRLESPQAAGALIASFVETWNESSADQKLESAMFDVRGVPPGGSGHVWLFNQDPFRDGGSMAEAMMTGLYAAANRTVWLIQPYTFVNPEILRPVRQLARRGVEINVVLSSRTLAPRFRNASFYGIEDLLDAGARVWITESNAPPLHYKCVLVDDALACVGSANLNWRSYHLARELGVVFDDPAAVASVRKVVDAVRARCREVSRPEARRYRTPRNFASWMFMQAGG